MEEGNEVQIVAVDKNNFDALIEMDKQLALYSKVTPPDEDALVRLRADYFNEKPKFEAYLAKLNGEFVGYLILKDIYSSFIARPTLFIENLFVVEEHRRHGVGQAIFDFCKMLAKERGCGRIDWVALSWNTAAIEFYKKNGAIHKDELEYFRLEINHDNN